MNSSFNPTFDELVRCVTRRLLPRRSHVIRDTKKAAREPRGAAMVSIRGCVSLCAGKKSTSWKPAAASAAGEGPRKRAEESPLQYAHGDLKKAPAAVEHVVEDYDGMRFLLVANTNGSMLITVATIQEPNNTISYHVYHV